MLQYASPLMMQNNITNDDLIAFMDSVTSRVGYGTALQIGLALTSLRLVAAVTGRDLSHLMMPDTLTPVSVSEVQGMIRSEFKAN